MRPGIARGAMVVLAALALVVPLPASSGFADNAPYNAKKAVTVVDLSVNGQIGDQAGIGDSQPKLAWRMASDDIQGNPCFDATARGECALDRQTAYEVEAAASAKNLQAGKLIWETGKVASSRQNVEFGRALGSRDSVSWRARVWDANGNVSPWSATSTFTVGLLQQSDWTAKWIEDPDYTYQTNGVPNPLPVFARQFDVGPSRLASATLYATGLRSEERR